MLGETCSASDSVEVLCLGRCSLPISTNLTDLTAVNTEFCTGLQKLIANRLQKDTAGTVEMLCLQRTLLVLENHN